MIDIYLGEGYNKEYLSKALRLINDHAPRELSYDFNNVEADVNIHTMLYIKHEDIDIYKDISSDFPGDLIICIVEDDASVYHQGKQVSGISILRIIEGMF
ncbi:TreA [Staphylococcus phage vB_Sau_CG]|nr:TreA [Staphylococcus phage vB_Sau_CG]